MNAMKSVVVRASLVMKMCNKRLEGIIFQCEKQMDKISKRLVEQNNILDDERKQLQRLNENIEQIIQIILEREK